jgi:hypothetical protein
MAKESASGKRQPSGFGWHTKENPRIRRNTKEVGLTGTNARQNWLDCLEQDAPRYQ